jgi:6-phosphogluconolactonase
MNYRSIALATVAAFALNAPAAPLAAQPKGPCGPAGCRAGVVYIGTHEDAIYAARLDPATGALSALRRAAPVERPTWVEVSPDGKALHAVSETGNDGKSQGSVASFAIDRATGALTPTGKVASGGGGATHLAYSARLGTVFVANWGGGQVGAISVGPNGGVRALTSTVMNSGKGPLPVQFGPHPHGIAVAADGRHVFAADLGADRIFIYRYDAASGTLSPAGAVATPPGSGPRHLVTSPDGKMVYLLAELSAQVIAYRWDGATAQLAEVQQIAVDPADFTGAKSAAEIAISRDGRFVYASSRGTNTIVTFAVDPRTGALTRQQAVPAGGDLPWSFGIDPTGKWLLVANEKSGSIDVLAVDPRKGTLRPTRNTLPVPHPVAVSFGR